MTPITCCVGTGAPRARSSRAPGALVALVCALGLPAHATIYTDHADKHHDWLARPTDPNGSLPFDLELHRPIDLLNIRVGPWRPDDPALDIFDGRFLPPGEFVRIDVKLCGLVNPPGQTRPDNFDPFLFGPHPAYGFIEFDLDDNVETGGELDAPEYRYVGNAVRFGSKPSVEPLEDRIALEAMAFDGDFMTAPFVDRSGEEFHLALLGSVACGASIEVLAGDADQLFEVGEVWRMTAPWFHRAHGFEPFSLAFGGHAPGSYEPDCVVQFAHDSVADQTTISLVFPLTNLAAAQMWDESEEPSNADPTDQYSILEGLEDLKLSAQFLDEFPSGLPEEDIIADWATETPVDHLDPDDWRITAVLGTSYTTANASGEYFVWTDIYPDGLRGDVNGDDEAAQSDRDRINNYIQAHDDDDGIPDGRVILPDYPVNFNHLDVDHSGVIDALDVALVSLPGDQDDDGDVDLLDIAALQQCVSGAGVPYASPACGLGDRDTDGDVDYNDWVRTALDWFGPDPCLDRSSSWPGTSSRKEDAGP